LTKTPDSVKVGLDEVKDFGGRWIPVHWFNVAVEVSTGALGREETDALLDGLLGLTGNVRAFKVEAGTVLGGVEAHFAVSDVSGITEVVQAVESTLWEFLPSGWSIERLEVTSDRKLNEDLSKPQFVGVTEIAGLLGVSRQRVDQLRREHPGFPSPDTELASGPVWRTSRLRTFLGTRDPTPGRPKSDPFAAVRRRGDLYLIPAWAVATAPAFAWIKKGVDSGVYHQQSDFPDGRDAFVPIPIRDFQLDSIDHLGDLPVAYAMRRSLTGGLTRNTADEEER
jgi:hypothetical protein